MHATIRTTLIRIAAVGGALALAGAVTAAPAQAHETPKAGSTCAMSGMAMVDHGKAYVCTSKTPTGKARWGVGVPTSKSPLTLANGWAKAADTGMSAAFGTISNPTKKPIRVIGALTTYSDVVQLHEVVDKDGSMVMQQKAGGFVIPAGGSVELKPGGNHMMFMGITKPITAGRMVPITLVTADGGLLTVKVMGKVYDGANETYNGSSMSGM